MTTIENCDFVDREVEAATESLRRVARHARMLDGIESLLRREGFAPASIAGSTVGELRVHARYRRADGAEATITVDAHGPSLLCRWPS